MKPIMLSFLLLGAVVLVAEGQEGQNAGGQGAAPQAEAKGPSAPEGGALDPSQAGGAATPLPAKRIILEEKQVSAALGRIEMKLGSGTQIELETGAQANVTKFEMRDRPGEALEGLKITDGEVRVTCPAEVRLAIWVPDGDIDVIGGEHSVVVVKDGWRQRCVRPVASILEKKTGAKWQMQADQSVRVERANRCVLITHEKDSTKMVFVAIPEGWIVHTLKGEDLRPREERVFSGRGVDALRRGNPLKVPMIVRLDPADALLIIPAELPAGQSTAIEPPDTPPKKVSPYR